MEHEEKKFRLRLNLFDGIVLILVLAVGAFLVWRHFRSAPPPEENVGPAVQTIRYTVEFSRWDEGVSSLIQVGDSLVDSVRNVDIGKVTAVEAVPASAMFLNQEKKVYELHTLPGLEDVRVTVESDGTIDERAVSLNGSYPIRVGQSLYIRGEGYVGSGPVISIEQGGSK